MLSLNTERIKQSVRAAIVSAPIVVALATIMPATASAGIEWLRSLPLAAPRAGSDVEATGSFDSMLRLAASFG